MTNSEPPSGPPERHDSDKRQSAEEPQPAIPVVKQPVVSAISEERPKKNKRSGWKQITRVIKVGTFVVIIVGTGAAYWTLVELRRQTSTLEKQTAALEVQTKALNEQVYSGERAYLLIRNVSIATSGGLTANSFPDLRWEIVNVGRTPAQRLVTRYAIYIGPRGSEPPPEAMEGYSEGRTLGPGEVEPSPSIFGTWLGGDSMAGKPLGDRFRLLQGPPETRLYLNARITVLYGTVFPDINGQTDICAYYEGSRFSYCGVAGTNIQ